MARLEKEINWDVVEKRMEAGCNGQEIAAAMRVTPDTFYNRFRKEYGKSFQDCVGYYRGAGESNIRFTQYIKAMGGNISMLQYLGRERLGQGKDKEQTSPFEDLLAITHENMILRSELKEIKDKLSGPR